MSQSIHQDLESGNDRNTGRNPSQPRPTRDPSLLSSKGGIDDRDSSWPLYALYSKIAQGEDNNDAERRQKDADGILVFTGLFSATVAALLAVTIPDLKVTESSSQDTSAFYLEKFYLLLANPNASVESVPYTFAAPLQFPEPPPDYIVWVNTLWFLALLISLSGAALATLERDFISRHISITQDKEHLPEMQGRIRAMLVTRPYAFIGLRRRFKLLSMLHLSLFLFLAGVLIYFFNISIVTFMVMASWIGSFIISYALFTVRPLFRPTELFYTPFSPMVFDLYVNFLKAISKALSLIIPGRQTSAAARMRYYDLNLPYKEGFIGCRTESAEKEASKPSQEIDTEVLERILLVLDNDLALEGFFGTIPAFCTSEMVHKPLNVRVTSRLQQTLDAFLDRTFSSHLVTEPARNHRLITCLNAAHSALGPSGVSDILGKFFNGHRDEALKSVEIGHSLIRWGHSNDDLIEPNVRRIVACIIAHPQVRDDRWAKLVKAAFDIPDGVNRDYLADVDSVLLAILIHVTREVLLTDHLERGVFQSLSQFDIRNTSAELRHDFCALWNQIVQEAGNRGIESTPTQILAEIRHPFTTLHQGTDSDPIRPCNVASHHPDSAADNINHATISPIADPVCGSDSGGNSVLQRAEEAGTMAHPLALGSLPTPNPTPALNSGKSVILIRSIDSSLMQTDHDRRSLDAPSSTSTAIPLSVSPQVVTVSDQYPDVPDGTTGAQYDNQDTHLILSEDSRQAPPCGATTGL